jgi:hypothetical protein
VQASAPVFVRSRSDIESYVAAKDRNAPPPLAEALVDCIAMDSDAPNFGDDWGPWLDANFARVRERAVADLEVTEVNS